MKHIKLTATVVLTLSLLISGTTAGATKLTNQSAYNQTLVAGEPRASAQLHSYSVYMLALGGGKIAAVVDVYGIKNPMAKIGVSSLNIEIQNGNGSWTSVKEFTNDYVYSEMDFHKTFDYLALPGATYRASVEVYAKDNAGGSDTGSITSGSIKAK